MKDIKIMLEKRRESMRKRQRDNYALARKLGFSSIEAGALAQRSQKNILIYAENLGIAIPENMTI